MSQTLGIQTGDKATVSNPDIEKKQDEQKKDHPVFGKWKKVIVHPVNAMNKNQDIFVSVNSFGRQFKPGKEVSLPQGIIDFLKSSGDVEHYFDKEAVSELSGKRGLHTSRIVKQYMVETVE